MEYIVPFSIIEYLNYAKFFFAISICNLLQVCHNSFNIVCLLILGKCHRLCKNNYLQKYHHYKKCTY